MENLSLIFKAETHLGLKRSVNEDSFGTSSNSYGNLFVVCDGMGGHAGGAVASKTAVDCIIEYFQNHEGDNPVQAIHESIKFANTQIFARAQMEPELQGMGTTCVVLLIQRDGKAYFGHVGDSRIYLMTGGKLVRLTKDHSFVQLLVDSGEITEEEAESHPKKNQILKALGIDEHVKPEICSEAACPSKGDIFLLCSDGLSGMTSESNILHVLKNESKSGYVSALIQLALDGGGKDNITAIAVEVESSPFTKTFYKVNQTQNGTHQKNIAPAIGSALSKKSRSILLTSAALLCICLAAGAYFYFGDPLATPQQPLESTKQDSSALDSKDSLSEKQIEESSKNTKNQAKDKVTNKAVSKDLKSDGKSKSTLDEDSLKKKKATNNTDSLKSGTNKKDVVTNVNNDSIAVKK